MSGLSIEQRLLILSEAIKHKSFEMDAKRVSAILDEAAKTIRKLRSSNDEFSATADRPIQATAFPAR
jgi:hypothetical protein